MKRSLIWKITLITLSALIIFTAVTVGVVSALNSRQARNNVADILSVLEKEVVDNKLKQADFAQFVKQPYDSKIRITVINLDGSVAADTSAKTPESLDNHLNRPEVKTALSGGTGTAVRRSGSFGTRYVYAAKKVAAGDGEIILRAAVPVAAVNSYLWAMVGIMAVITAAVVLITVPLSAQVADGALKPVSMIKAKLDSVGKADEVKITLTPYDEINAVLAEADEISERLNAGIFDYKREKEKNDFILENINLGIIAVDKNYKIAIFNKIAKEYFDFVEESASIYIAIRDVRFVRLVKKAFVNREFSALDMNYGESEILEIKLIPVESSDIKLIVTAQPVTDIRKLQREKQEFFVNASHELNTPLSSVLGYAELMIKEKKYKEEFAKAIYKQSERMKALIGDMMKLSQLEEGKEIHDERLDLKAVCKEAAAAFKPKAEQKGIKLSAELESLYILANKEKLIEIVSNLTDNALKYTDGGGEVKITLAETDGRALLSVKDNGIGIAPHHLPRITERFYRTDKGRSRAEGGTGLGLAIVKHICSHYNAPLNIKSKENAGTEVTISFALIE